MIRLFKRLFRRFTVDKKANLIEALKAAVLALENNIVFFDWSKPWSCNCGIVVQAMLGENYRGVQLKFAKAVLKAPEVKSEFTWRSLVQETCSATGLSSAKIIRKLTSLGLAPMDIVHLEFLENPAILSLSGIEIEYKYFKKQRNLILYLKAWISILEGTSAQKMEGKNLLHADLLIASAMGDERKVAKVKQQLIGL